jgi:hypothetical protein
MIPDNLHGIETYAWPSEVYYCGIVSPILNTLYQIIKEVDLEKWKIMEHLPLALNTWPAKRFHEIPIPL